MGGDWARLCTGKDVTVEDDVVEVRFTDGRRHRVNVEDLGDALQLRAVVMRRAAVETRTELALSVWARNRRSTLVGFRIDPKKGLLGEAWVPKTGLTAKELQIYLRAVGAECDRFEFELTGKDVE